MASDLAMEPFICLPALDIGMIPKQTMSHSHRVSSSWSSPFLASWIPEMIPSGCSTHSPPQCSPLGQEHLFLHAGVQLSIIQLHTRILSHRSNVSQSPILLNEQASGRLQVNGFRGQPSQPTLLMLDLLIPVRPRTWTYPALSRRLSVKLLNRQKNCTSRISNFPIVLFRMFELATVKCPGRPCSARTSSTRAICQVITQPPGAVSCSSQSSIRGDLVELDADWRN